jgi:hypothetical protein
MTCQKYMTGGKIKKIKRSIGESWTAEIISFQTKHETFSS